ncbi:tripeptidyl peptidase SED3 [Cordyceps fumosorosea ARSEF 2679]|uniref:tripeptidyl-peptidase II n=1 Tax=Cordyceps fumosorosea (strain ARSEF 2679) TaxID=1081104 RepID=A0A167V7Z3_CORFA|nr:tripeptidyl peptidase SED3 [Cordyceps fumosorosea ARSEF 2679]OAA62327.1 tripeptidyl peptidase SED3 [Cordyceps fumosorosea ARSEF 2679]
MHASLLPLFAALAAASPSNLQMALKQALQTIPQGWEVHSDAPADQKIDLHIGIKEQNLDELQKRVLEMSTPGHADYGKHMTKDEVEALTSPTKETLQSVTSWLSSHGIEAGSVTNGLMPITVTVSKAEQMLGTKYKVYHHAADDKYTIRTTQYSLPQAVHSEVTMIQPTTMFSDMGMINRQVTASTSAAKATKRSKAKRSGCDGSSVTPACLRDLYDINYTPSSSKSLLGVCGYLEEVASQSDLSTFLKKNSITNAGKLSIELVNNGSNSGSGTTEADLDIEYTVGLSAGINNVFYSTGGRPPWNPDSGSDPNKNTNEPYLDWLNYMLNKTDIPQTISSSYGDDEQTVPKDYADNVCNLFMKLGARGVSFLCSSGDGGVSGGQPTNCQANDGSGATKFLPTFPASCPWVTAVGGTTGTPESAADLSSGGFSEYYAAPDYQSSATSGYVSSIGDQYSGMYNPKGRGIPDVSAQALNFQTVIAGRNSLTSGTSASCPTFAAIISLLNDYRLSQGQSPLGFLNPWLYSNATSGLNDITSGSNPGCQTQGFSASTGWDPVTGLGTPDLGKLLKLV